MPADKIKHIKRDSAVSPAIAAILIVMMTIFMVGVFAIVIVDMGGTDGSGKVVGVTADTYSSNSDRGITVTVWGGKDVGELTGLRAYVGNIDLYYNNGENTVAYNPVIGGKYPFSTSNPDLNALKNELVNIVGIFSDGTEQVLCTSNMIVSSTTSNNGVYLENEYIRVYTDKDVGHGLIFEILQPKNVSLYKSGTIKTGTDSYTNADSLIDSYQLIRDLTNPEITVIYNIFKDSGNIAEYIKTDEEEHKHYFLPINLDNIKKILPYNRYVNELPITNQLKGNVDNSGRTDELELDITINITIFIDGEGKRVPYELNNVIIPERVNIFETAYNGNIFNYVVDNSSCGFKDTIQVKLDENINYGDEKGYLAFFITKYDSKEHILIHLFNGNIDSNYFDDVGGHTVYTDFNLEDTSKYSDSDVFEVYISGDNSCWYLVDSKTIGELIP